MRAENGAESLYVHRPLLTIFGRGDSATFLDGTDLISRNIGVVWIGVKEQWSRPVSRDISDAE
jgi:hypothetical protein